MSKTLSPALSVLIDTSLPCPMDTRVLGCKQGIDETYTAVNVSISRARLNC